MASSHGADRQTRPGSRSNPWALWAGRWTQARTTSDKEGRQDGSRDIGKASPIEELCSSASWLK
eukprot:10744463-Alexandrium_andersonii.AAC.1